MDTAATAGLTYQGRSLLDESHAPGRLAVTATDAGGPELRERLDTDGYVLLRDALPREEVLEAGHELYRRIAAAGQLHPDYPTEEGIAAPGVSVLAAHDAGRHNPPLERVVFGTRMLAVFERIFGAPVRHFDYIWVRAKSPGLDTPTPPHYDIVFMGRGTRNLLTGWTPLCDAPIEMGGLMILEGSHRLTDVRETYGRMDVDTYCAGTPEERPVLAGESRWVDRHNGGHFTKDATSLPGRLGGRWLMSDYRAGDLLVFTMHTMHSAGDNHTGRVRVSSDTRYQRASEPVDERWIGEDPIAHGPGAKRGLIC